MALRNGLLIHGPTHWAAAVRDPRGQDPGRLTAQAGSWRRSSRRGFRACAVRSNWPRRWPCLPLARRGLPAARLPFENWRVVAAVGATLGATALVRKRLTSSTLREAAVQAIGTLPALVALMDRDLAAYHGVEHKAIAAYEQGVDDPASVPKEHDRCGSNLIAPMMLLSAGGTVLARAPGREPGTAGSGRRRPRRRLDCGRDVRLERSPP